MKGKLRKCKTNQKKYLKLKTIVGGGVVGHAIPFKSGPPNLKIGGLIWED